MRNLVITAISLLFITVIRVDAQNADGVFRAAGSPENPKVPMSWNRYNNHAGITDICRKLAAAHPDLVQLSSIGKSFQGRDMWLLTITDFKKGKSTPAVNLTRSSPVIRVLARMPG